MLEAIELNEKLRQICRESCAENNVEIEFCDALVSGGLLDQSIIKILKVDEYYSSKNFPLTPKAIDCMIVVRCESGEFEITLAELRDVKSTRGIPPRDILDKFKTVFHKFMAEDFFEIFANPEYRVKKIEAWLVSDPFNMPHLSDEEYRKKVGSTRLDVIQSEKPFSFRGHSVPIRPLRPNPEICSC